MYLPRNTTSWQKRRLLQNLAQEFLTAATTTTTTTTTSNTAFTYNSNCNCTVPADLCGPEPWRLIR